MAKYEIRYIPLGTEPRSESYRLLMKICELKSQENPDMSMINSLEYEREEALKSELEATLNYYSNEGWELVQMSQSLLEGRSVDGYALFRKDNSNEQK